MGVRLNVFTGALQFTDSLIALENLLNGIYLKIDQTTPQVVINGAPEFSQGIVINKDQRVYLDGTLV